MKSTFLYKQRQLNSGTESVPSNKGDQINDIRKPCGLADETYLTGRRTPTASPVTWRNSVSHFAIPYLTGRELGPRGYVDLDCWLMLIKSRSQYLLQDD